MKAPEYTPGELIPPMAYPSSILSQHIVKRMNIGTHHIAVARFNCAHHAHAILDDDYDVLILLQHDTILLQHPQQHRARIALQASPHLLDDRFFFFIETWEKRAGGGHLDPYAHHVGMLDVTTGTVTTYKDQDDYDVWYKDVDVDAMGKHLLLSLGFDRRGYAIEVVQSDSNNWIEFDCGDLYGRPLSEFQWGTTINIVRCFHEFDACYYDLPIDWEHHRILWNPITTPSTE